MNEKALLSLEDEVRNVKDYVELENIRFANKVKFHISPMPKHWSVPKFSIQLIVENAIKHGFEEHSLKAFDIGAVGYLVKPYSLEQLKKAMQRKNTSKQKEQDLYILSKTGDNYLLLKPQEIFYVKADLSEVMFRSAKGFSYYAQKISDLQKRLEKYKFVRIHRSYLININEIKDIQTVQQSKLRFTFRNISDTIESNKDGAKAFRKMFE